MKWRRGLLGAAWLLCATPATGQDSVGRKPVDRGPAATRESAARDTAASKAPGATRGTAAPGAPVASPPERPRFAWPRVQVLEAVEASEIVEAGGIPVALRAVHTQERLDALVQRFADAFLAAGLHVPPGKEQPQLASGAVMLTAIDGHRGITYTVIFQPQPDRTTMLYLGEANHALRRDPAAAGDFAPMPPNARQVLRVNGEGSRTLSFQVPLSGAQVDAFYADALKRAGWRLEEGETSFYVRPGEELRVVHEPGEANQRAVVLVYRGGRTVMPPAPGPGPAVVR